MPRVLPSEVVRVIEALFPGHVENNFQGILLVAANLSALEVISELVEQIPEELITLQSSEYSALIAGVAGIRSELASVSSVRQVSGRNIVRLTGFDQTPVALVHGALEKCPDNAPSAQTAGLEFIEEEGLRDNLRLDISSAETAISNGEWKGATVLAGSVVEALLLWALQARSPSDIRSTIEALRQSEPSFRDPGENLERWDMYSLIEVAAKLQVISTNTAGQCRLAKDFRNLIHPGRAQRLGEVCDRATALSAMAAVEHGDVVGGPSEDADAVNDVGAVPL